MRRIRRSSDRKEEFTISMLNLNAAVGIEVGENRLVLSAVTKGLRGFKVASHLILEDFRNLDPAELHKKVQEFVSTKGLSTENVIVGIGRDQVLVKEVELPLEVEENLDQVVKFQVDKLGPSDDSLVCYDYLVLNRNKVTKKLTLQIVVTSQETVDSLVKLLANMGLQPTAIRLSSVGLNQIMGSHQDGKTEYPAIIVCCEKDSVEVVLVDGHSRNFSLHRTSNSQEDDTLLLSSVLDDLFSQVDLRNVDHVQGIYLVGSASEEKVELIRERFGEAELLSDGVSLDLGSMPRGSLDLTGCSVGLAISALTRNPFSKFDLMPPEMGLARSQFSYIPTFVLVGLMIFLVGLSAGREYVQNSRLLAGYEIHAVEMKPLVDSVTDIRGEVDQLSHLATELRTMFNGRQKVLLVLKELTEVIPRDAYLQNVRIETSKVIMTGFSDNASNLIPILQQSKCLTNVESKYITRDRRSGKDKFSFEANIDDCS